MITEQEVLALADSMAASASNLNAMTYDTLMNSRSELQSCIKELFKEINNGATDHRKL